MSTQVESASANSPIITALDGDGRIVWVNGGWQSFGDRNGLSDGYDAVGENYLAVTEGANDEHAERVATGLGRIFDGEVDSFATVYPCHGPDEERWFQVYVTTTESTGDASYLVVHRRVTDHAPDREAASMTTTKFQVDEPPVSDGNRLVTYSIPGEGSVIDGLLTAFEALGVDVQTRGTTLQDWIETDALKKLFGSAIEFTISFDVWDHPVVVTDEVIQIHAPVADS